MDIFELFPITRDAIQPPPRPRSVPRWSPRDWGNDVQRVRARWFAPPQGTLVGPFAGVGDCLEPYTEPHTSWLAFIDPTREPRHDDFVVVRWSDKSYAEVCQIANKEWLAAVGRAPSRLAAKRLAWVGGQWWLTLADGKGIELGDSHICGVIAHVQRPPMADAIRIEKVAQTEVLGLRSVVTDVLDDDAATEVTALVLADDTISGATFPNFQEADAISYGTIDFDCDCILTLFADAKLSSTPSGTEPGYLAVQCVQRASGGPAGPFTQVWNTGNTQSYSARHIFPLAAGASPVFQAFFRAGQDGVSGVDLEYENAILTVELVKK